MAIVTTVTSVSHRYYARKAKSEIIARLQDLSRAAGGVELPSWQELLAESRDQLAHRALRLHALLPEAA